MYYNVIFRCKMKDVTLADVIIIATLYTSFITWTAAPA